MNEIYTYSNPLKMNQDELIWKIINQYPQFCASDTLVQGMIQHYGRKEFSIIRTVDELQKALVGNVTNNVQFDMQLSLDVSRAIREKIDDLDIKKSFQSNKGEVVNSIRYLLFLEAEPKKLLNIESPNKDQLQLFNVYKAIYSKYAKIIDETINKTKEDVKEAIKSTVLYEAKYLLKQYSKKIEQDDVTCKTLDEAEEKLTLLKEYYNRKIAKRDIPEWNNTARERNILARVSYTLDLIANIDSIEKDTIIIHGVHKFTPEILLMIRLLENSNINVIFLIHYVDQLPQIYQTWKEVYSWTGVEFKNVKPFNLSVGSKTGKEIAKIMSGSLSFEPLSSVLHVYDNLSSFAVGEVRPEFQHAAEDLRKMKVQYYAVNNADTNEMLKNYFPDQFEVKPFLSYPVGQFVLGIYNMWDFENSRMKLVPEALRECVVSGMFENEVGRDIAKIYDDIILYISDLENIEDVLKRLAHLKKERGFIDRNTNLTDMKSICYFSRSLFDIDRFIKYLNILNEVSQKIFAHEEGEIDFGYHFKNMMEILSEPFSNLALEHRTEIQLAQGILLSLGGYDSIKGDYLDLKEALMFYLHQSSIDDSSNWIVRNFEQLDGAVLLADHTKAREYHFALLSMKNMTKKVSDELPWPLSEELFYDYDSGLKNSMHACAMSNKERSNFLKYSLFYGVFFFKKRIVFSYVLNQNNEKQRAYYLLNLLQMRKLGEAENKDVNFETPAIKHNNKLFNYGSLTIDEKEMFAICRYRYFLFRVLGEEIIYSNDFQIRYYLRNFFTQIILDDKTLSRKNMSARVDQYLDRFSIMFPNYDAVVFEDIRKNVKADVESRLKYCSDRNIKDFSQQEEYKRRKRNFLLAKWDDSMNFDDVSSSKVIDYMVNDSILLETESKPHVKVCETCNYYADCLMKYYEGNRLKENEV